MKPAKELKVQEIKKIIAKIANFKMEEINDQITIRNGLNIDSLKAMEIIVKVEKVFNINIDELEMLRVATVGDFISIVERELKK